MLEWVYVEEVTLVLLTWAEVKPGGLGIILSLARPEANSEMLLTSPLSWFWSRSLQPSIQFQGAWPAASSGTFPVASGSSCARACRKSESSPWARSGLSFLGAHYGSRVVRALPPVHEHSRVTDGAVGQRGLGKD